VRRNLVKLFKTVVNSNENPTLLNVKIQEKSNENNENNENNEKTKQNEKIENKFNNSLKLNINTSKFQQLKNSKNNMGSTDRKMPESILRSGRKSSEKIKTVRINEIKKKID